MPAITSLAASRRVLASFVEKASSQRGYSRTATFWARKPGAPRRRLALRRRHALHQKCWGPNGYTGKAPRSALTTGGDGARTMMLVYNLPRTDAIFDRFGGVAVSASLIGGFGMTALTGNDIVACRSVPVRVSGLAPMLAISNSRHARRGTRSDYQGLATLGH